jgi:hypothetical protein
MPTSSAAGFESRSGAGVGVEAAHAISEPRWQAAVGNRVGLVSFQRFDRIREGPGDAGRFDEVAIDASPQVRLYSLFVRHVKIYFAFYSPVHPYRHFVSQCKYLAIRWIETKLWKCAGYYDWPDILSFTA